MEYKSLKEFIEKIKEKNKIKNVKIIPHLHEEIIGCLYLNKEVINNYTRHYEISNNILYIQGIIMFDNITEYYEYLDKEDSLIYKELFERASKR